MLSFYSQRAYILLVIQHPHILNQVHKLLLEQNIRSQSIWAFSTVEKLEESISSQKISIAECAVSILQQEDAAILHDLQERVLADILHTRIALLSVQSLVQCPWFVRSSASSLNSLSSQIRGVLWRYFIAVRNPYALGDDTCSEILEFLYIVSLENRILEDPIARYIQIPTVLWDKVWVRGSWDKERALAKMSASAQHLSLGSLLQQRYMKIVEELCSNAIYDAVCTSRERGYGVVHKRQELSLKPQHWPYCEWAYDGYVLAVGMKDCWGNLTIERAWKHLRKLHDQALCFDDNIQGGAGLGLYHLYYLSDALIFFVKKHYMTYVLSLNYVQQDMRRVFPKFPCDKQTPKSVCFFEL